MTDICSDLTIIRAQELFSTGELTSVALVKHFLHIIDTREADIHAYREVFNDVLEQAEHADALRHDITNTHGGDTRAWIRTHPLLGMPISIKDNILIKGRIAGASSKILEDYVAPYDATVITKLKNAGAIFIGRVNMDEFAMGGSTENSAYGPTRNPYDSTRVAGGSSGGSIASVAMDAALASLGSDTGGSIRQPAAYCGVVGLKPTYGSVSRHGLMAMGSSLDVIGPVTRSVDDAELLFSIIKGKDIHDGTSHDNVVNAGVSERSVPSMTSMQAVSSVASATSAEAIPLTHGATSAAGAPLVVGIIPELMNMGGIDSAVLENFNATINQLREQGVEVREISLPRISYSLATYYIVMPAEVSSNMGRFDGIKYGNHIEGDSLLADYMNTRGHLLGKEVRRRIILGAYVLSAGYYDAYYNRANSVRELLKADFNTAFESVSVIATPTAPTPAFKIGANTSDPVKMYLEDVFTVPANLVGIPAISVPTGYVDATHPQDAGLPLAIQFMASHGHESLLFDISRMIESKRTA